MRIRLQKSAFGSEFEVEVLKPNVNVRKTNLENRILQVVVKDMKQVTKLWNVGFVGPTVGEINKDIKFSLGHKLSHGSLLPCAPSTPRNSYFVTSSYQLI